MLDQSKIPGLGLLASSLNDVLPEDHSRGDPSYLSKAAVEIFSRSQIEAPPEIAAALSCAKKYWNGEASEEEREAMRISMMNQFQIAESQFGKDSSKASQYALAAWALDVVTPSSGFASDYLLEHAVRAGASVETIQLALERSVPGLSESIQARSRR